MNNFGLIQIVNVLHKHEDKKLPQKIGYAIMKNIMQLQSEVMLYEQQLKQIFDAYDEHLQKDDKGEIIYQKNGLPIVVDETANKFYQEIQDLINADADAEVFKIDAKYFDYDDSGSRYDPLTPQEIMELMNILTKKDNE